MKCPTCKYEFRWSYEEGGSFNGGKGEFYQSSVTSSDGYVGFRMQRGFEQKQLCGCPSCGTVFVDIAGGTS